MADNQKFVQAQPFVLAGAGTVIGATTITLTSFTTIDGTALAITDFGAKGYFTLEPGSGDQEEAGTFTGVTQNANGTATLTGVKTQLTISPYTETSGLAKTHPGGVKLVISNTAGFYNGLTSKSDDETISGTWTFTNPNYPRMDTDTPYPTDNEQLATKAYADSLAFAGAPNATTTQKGIVELPTQAEVDARTSTGGTGASLTPTPANLRTVLTHDLAASSAGTDAYAITLTPTVTAYAQGDVFRFKADVANTGACTLNVNGLGAISLKVYGANPRDNYITANSIVECIYNSTGPVMNITSVSSQSQISQDGQEVYAASTTGNDTYVVTMTPAPTAYTTGMHVYSKVDTGNTGAATININSLGAKTITKVDGSALQTGNIPANGIIHLVYDGTNFQLMNPIVFQEYVFTSSGSWLCPAGVTSVYVDIQAGGGAGGTEGNDDGSGGGGGGGAGASNVTSSVTPYTLYTVTVGAGGVAGSSNGGNSVFNGITKTGGTNGGAGNGSTPGTAGAAGDASAGAGGAGNFDGRVGVAGSAGTGPGTGGGVGTASSPNYSSGGGGGAGYFGSGAASANAGPGVAGVAGSTGGGGGSGASNQGTGGTGGAGFVIIKVPLTQTT